MDELYPRLAGQVYRPEERHTILLQKWTGKWIRLSWRIIASEGCYQSRWRFVIDYAIGDSFHNYFHSRTSSTNAASMCPSTIASGTWGPLPLRRNRAGSMHWSRLRWAWLQEGGDGVTLWWQWHAIVSSTLHCALGNQQYTILFLCRSNPGTVLKIAWNDMVPPSVYSRIHSAQRRGVALSGPLVIYAKNLPNWTRSRTFCHVRWTLCRSTSMFAWKTINKSIKVLVETRWVAGFNLESFSENLPLIDFKGEAITFKTTTAAVLATLEYCAELVAQREESWRKRLEKEVEKRRRCERLSKSYFDQIQKSRTSHPGPDLEVRMT